MKIIFKIARAELKTLFYSPIAWFVIFVFYVTGAAIFSLGTEQFTIVQEVYKDLIPNWQGFEGAGRELSGYILIRLMKYIYLFIPLITMGIINREISNGTIKLLYSSPVSTREIVIGKYFGVVIFNMVLLFIFGVILASMGIVVENVEYFWFLSILLGMFLLVNTYAAIGLFISSLTGYQIVAAIITFAVLFLLSVISGFGQQYDLIRDITWFLSISGKAELMMNGLITSRDVIYFILVIVLFNGFSLIRMNGTQQPVKWTVSVSKYAILSLAVMLIGYLSSRPGYILYADITKDKLNTIHPDVQDAIKEMDGSPLTVTLYTNLFDLNAKEGLPVMRNNYVWRVWEKYVRFYPNINFRYVYYYDLRDKDSSYFKMYPGKSIEEIARIEAGIKQCRFSLFKKPEEIRKEIDLGPEGKFLIMQLEYKGRKEFLRTYRQPPVWPGQPNFAATFKRLTRAGNVKVGFVTGHYERDAFDYAPRNFGTTNAARWERTSLINNGVDIDSVRLSDGPVPDNINLLVMADPRSDYNEIEQGRINDYLRKGGNFLAREKWMYKFQRYNIDGGKVQNEGAADLHYEEIDGFRIEPVVTMPGHENTWVETGQLVLDSAAPVYSAEAGDLRKAKYTLALKLTRKVGQREQRIIVCGDADMMSNKKQNLSTAGLAFYSWALDNNYPVYTNYPRAQDMYMKVTTPQAKKLTLVYLYLVPVLLLLSAIVLLVRRKRK